MRVFGIYKIEIPIYRFFSIFSSVFGIFRYFEYRLRWNTIFGIGILKYLGIRYQLPTQD